MGQSEVIRDAIFSRKLAEFWHQTLLHHEAAFFGALRSKSPPQLNDQFWAQQKTEYRYYTYGYLLSLFAAAYTIHPRFPLNDLEDLTPFVLRVLPHKDYLREDIIENLLAFLSTYTYFQEEDKLDQAAPEFTPLMPQLVFNLFYCREGVCRQSMDIISNLTSTKSNAFTLLLHNTNFVRTLEDVFTRAGLVCGNVTLLTVLYNIFSGDTPLKHDILASQVVMNTLVDQLVLEKPFQDDVVAVFKNLFKGPYTDHVPRFFLAHPCVFELCVRRVSQVNEPKKLRNLEFLLKNLMEMDLFVRTGPTPTAFVDFAALARKPGFREAAAALQTVASTEKCADLYAVALWIRDNLPCEN